MDESTQNPGKTDAGALTGTPKENPKENEDALEHVLDAWSSEPSSRQRYDRLRLERRDGESLSLLVDSDTARDLGDKLTIVAARARHRTRGAAGVPVDRSVDPGDAEDLARARKVIDLAGGPLDGPLGAVLRPMAEEFKTSRLDVEKAHAMLDEQAKHHAAANALSQKMFHEQCEVSAALRSELESVKADRANLIAEAAQRDIEIGATREALADVDDGHSAIDLSDPSEPAPP